MSSRQENHRIPIHCLHSSSLSLVEIDTSLTYALEEFMVVQERCLSRTVEGLQRLREEIAAVIVTTCKVNSYYKVVTSRGFLLTCRDL